MITSEEAKAMEALRAAIDGAGLMACVRYDHMSLLASFVSWHRWRSSLSTGKVFCCDAQQWVTTVEVPLSDAREMLRRAEQRVADAVFGALS